MKRVIFILIILSVFLNSCDKCEESNRQKQIQVNQGIFSDSIISQSNTRKQALSESDMLDSKMLEKYLPEFIPGFQKYPGSGGQFYGENYTWTTASSDYKHYRMGYFSIGIFDYGKNGYIPERNSFYVLPNEPGMLSKKIKVNNGFGYLIQDKYSNSGRLNILINQRFVIKIESYSLPADSPTLEKILNYIKINELLKN